MAYIGVQPTAGQYRKLDNISASFNGSTTSFTTSVGGTNVTAGTAQQLIVSLGGVIQQPDTDYTVSTNTITFTTAPTSGLDFFAILMGDALNTVTPSDGSVTTAKLAGSLSVGLAAGSVSAPSLFFTGDTNNGIYSPSTDAIAVTTAGSECARIDSSGRLLVGTTASYNVGSPGSALLQSVVTSSIPTGSFTRYTNDNDGAIISLGKSRGTSAGSFTVVQSGDIIGNIRFAGADGTDLETQAASIRCEVDGTPGANDMPGRLVFSTTADGASSPTERMRIDSSGRLLVGTTTSIPVGAATASNVQIAGDTSFQSLSRWANNGNGPALVLGKSRSATVGTYSIVSSGDTLGQLVFAGDDGTDIQTVAATIKGEVDGTPGANDMPGRLVFSTTADGASTVTERMRIESGGDVHVGKTSTDNTVAGISILNTTGTVPALVVVNTEASDTSAPFVVNRQGSDGRLAQFRQANTTEGTISVSGTTVTYGGGHLARWSQLLNNEDPSNILKGTVMSNLDEMCEWGDEDNEQLNKTKISDVEGDPNVAGVFVSTSFDEEGPSDFFVAMTGDMVIRIAEGVMVERGDLLMSAGDGTAKPQDDDIIRSKTIAKVTSTHVSCTYEDGSYCVPCVLMAC